jgi:tRNA nucleotidyltransferase (CCA-adding enzyme)
VNINIPEYVKEVLKRLHDGGYEAYVVGGCVRDSILGLMPDDWDVCTEAEPDEMKDCFIGLRSVDTGIQHGTVTAVSEGRPVEVTTYRIDGAYSDGRHPDAVTFTRSLREDLARRDFTINAMAYDPGEGLIDLFGGSEDLKRGLIRCVGDPNTRFSEDALRILRALRFSSKLGFRIEPETGRAVREMAETVKLVARERVGAEFVKLVLGKGASGVMVGFREALNASGIALMAEDESLRSVDALPRSLPVRLAVIFQDAAGQALKDLRLDRHTIASCLRIQEALCEDVPKDRVQLKLQMMQFGEDAERAMLEIRRVCARGDRALQEAERALDMLQAVLDRKEVWNLKQLQVSGKDLLQAGIPQGKLIGSALHHLLVLVIEGKLENKEEKLIETAHSLFCSGNL